MRNPQVAAAALVLLFASAAHADGGGEWVTAATGEITIKTRSVPGSPVREILAEGELNAPAATVAEAITNAERFPSFMPYVKEARFVGEHPEGGPRIVYTRLGLPFIAGRDFVIEDRVVQSLNADGTGQFVNEWRAVPDRLPARANFVRLKTNSGSWRVTPNGEGKSHVVYQFAVDPGGQIPAFVADIANRSGVPDVFKAIEKEARRLQTEQQAP
ncbi:MAG: START domain-containing protein [Myxococcaceae bacterium]